MTHANRFAVAVLVVLAVGAPVQAQTPEIDALRVRAEAGDAKAQSDLGCSMKTLKASRRTMCRRTCGSTSRPHE
jgi:hypothetical protein